MLVIGSSTYMQIQRLAIAPVPAHRRRHDDQLIPGDEVANAALFARGLVTGVGLDVELEGGDERKEEGEEELKREGRHVAYVFVQ